MTWLIWALFGNDDDGIYGDANWNPTRKQSWLIALLWWLRNPCHNMCFYVINVKPPFDRHSRNNWDVFAPTNYAFNWAYFASQSWFPYPFFSYNGALGKFYIGWRERGNFGIKCTGSLLIALILAIVYLII